MAALPLFLASSTAISSASLAVTLELGSLEASSAPCDLSSASREAVMLMSWTVVQRGQLNVSLSTMAEEVV
jgi:hypothetical protein